MQQFFHFKINTILKIWEQLMVLGKDYQVKVRLVNFLSYQIKWYSNLVQIKLTHAR